MTESIQNHKEKSLPELLAPAGSHEAFQAAVSAGADAVYLSGKRFGARKSAPNFTDDEIEKAIGYAHCRDIRVYVTVNTLVHDEELESVAEYLLWLYSIGADAVLVQDIGVAALARDIIPSLPLHASTQMTIHNTAGVRWAAEQGFSRVVLARELSLHEITRIAKETAGTGIGLEVFAHGALCYCYSGQCLLSSVIGGRSGNRGMCAQPCRKPYALVSGDSDKYGRPTGIHEIASKERYLLSPKDLCTYGNLPHLVTSPVVSLKIEGRMKSPEYVAIVVSTYRRALDAIAAGSAYSSVEAEQDLCLAFNRGLTPGYLFGKYGADLMGRDAPDNRGISIGIVSRYDKTSKTAVIQPASSLIPRPGDGLLFSHPDHPCQESGFSLNTVPVQKNGWIAIKVPHTVEPGTRLFITSSAELEMRARQIIAHPPTGLRHPVPVDVQVSIDASGRLMIEGTVRLKGKKGIPLVYQPDFCLVPARSHPLSREQIELHLKKTGGTPFTIRNFSLTYGGDLFTPLGGLNRVRREFLTLAEERVAASMRPSQERIQQAHQRWNSQKPCVIIQTNGTRKSVASSPALGVYADSLPGVQGAVKGGCDVICFEPVFTAGEGRCGIPAVVPSFESQILTASALCRDAGVRFILKFPRITKNTYFDVVLPILAEEQATGISGYMVENCGTAHALMHANPAGALSGSTGLNIFNYAAVRHPGARFGLLTLSPELSRDEIRQIIQTARLQGCATSFSVIVQGPVEAMVSEDCMLQPYLLCSRVPGDADNPRFYGIMDATGHIFPVRIDGECRSHVYNAKELCLIDHLPSLTQAGVNEVIIDARDRTRFYAYDMTRIYRQALALVKKGIRQDDHLFEQLKDTVKRCALGGITAGHYIHGLKES